MNLIKLDKDPNIVIDKKIINFLAPDYIYIPLKKTKINVKQNSYVYKYQKISLNEESSISGKAIGITKNNNKEYIAIENDFKELKQHDEYANKNITINSILNILEKKDDKLFSLFKSLKSCDNIVINIIQDEPYVLNNIISLKENIDDCLEMFDKLSVLYKSKNNFLTIKSVDSEIIESCLNTIGTYPNINIALLEDEYLLGRKEQLLNKLKLDINKTLYLNIQDFIKFINLVKYHKISSTKIITISGDALQTGNIFRIKKYTRLQEIKDKYLKITDKSYDIYINNLLNGNALSDVVIDDDISSIHFMKKKTYQEGPCIKCGLCLSVCPKNIDILYFLKHKTRSKECIKCGACTYVCPSLINLRKYLSGDKDE